jgi:hypothetical protein
VNPWALDVLHKSDHEPHRAPEQKNAEPGMSNFEGGQASDGHEKSPKPPAASRGGSLHFLTYRSLSDA